MYKVTLLLDSFVNSGSCSMNPIWRLCNPEDWLVKLPVMMRLGGRGWVSTLTYLDTWWYFVFTSRGVHLPQSSTVSKETPWRFCCRGRWKKRGNGRQTEVSIWSQTEVNMDWDRSRAWCETSTEHIRKGRKKLIACANWLLNATSDATAIGFLQY